MSHKAFVFLPCTLSFLKGLFLWWLQILDFCCNFLSSYLIWNFICLLIFAIFLPRITMATRKTWGNVSRYTKSDLIGYFSSFLHWLCLWDMISLVFMSIGILLHYLNSLRVSLMLLDVSVSLVHLLECLTVIHYQLYAYKMNGINRLNLVIVVPAWMYLALN